MTATKLAVLLSAVALAATGQLVLKHGMVEAQRAASDSGRSLVFVAATSPWIIGGLLIFAASAVGWLFTLAHVPLSVAYPFNSLGYVAILAASALLLHERTNPWMWLGTVLVGTGLVIVVLTAPASSASPARPQAHKTGATVSPDNAQIPPEPESTLIPPRHAK